MNSASISVSLFITPRPLSHHSPLIQGNANLVVVTENRDIILLTDSTSSCIFMRICLKVLLLASCCSFFLLFSALSSSSFHFVQGEQHACARTCTEPRPAQADFHINVCFRLLISSFFLVSSLHHVNEGTLSQEGWGWGSRGVRQTPYCMSTSMRNLNNRPCHTNHSLSVALGPATGIQISFHLSGKLKPGELTRSTFPTFHQQFGQPWGVILHILNRGRKQFAWDVLH